MGEEHSENDPRQDQQQEAFTRHPHGFPVPVSQGPQKNRQGYPHDPIDLVRHHRPVTGLVEQQPSARKLLASDDGDDFLFPESFFGGYPCP